MDYISNTINEVVKYDTYFTQSLADAYSKLDEASKERLELVVNSKIGNISLTPDKHFKLILYEWYVSNNPYKNPPEITNPNQYYAYNSNGRKIYLESKLSGSVYNYNGSQDLDSDSYVCVPNDYYNLQTQSQLQSHIINYIAYSGKIDLNGKPIPVTISLWNPEYRDIYDELSVWNFITESDIPTHFIDLDYKFMGGYVLVSERLQPLNEIDYRPENVYKLGIQILQILERVHRYGVLTDLSPTNIGKTVDGNYWIVSYSNFTDKPLYNGYLRTYWNKLWSSSVAETESVCTGKNDLLELGYLLNYLYLKNLEGDTNTGIVNRARFIEESITPRIYKYMSEVKSVFELDSNIYNVLRGILNDASLR